MYFKTTAKFKTKVSVAFGRSSVFARNVFSSYVILEMSSSFTLFLVMYFLLKIWKKCYW